MIEKAKKRILALSLACVLFLPIGSQAMVSAFFDSQDSRSVTISQEEYGRLQKYAQLDLMVNIIDAFYYQEPDVEAMIDYATHAALYQMRDPGTFYRSEAEAALIEGAREQTGDVGLTLGWEGGNLLLRVRAVVPGSPAEQAGIRMGDYLTAVNKEYFSGYELEVVQAMLRGEPGSEVEVTLYRGGQDVPYEQQYQELTLTRAEIEVPSQDGLGTWQENGFAGLALLHWSALSVDELSQVLEAWQGEGERGIPWVLDLRESEGGSAEQLVDVASLLLPAGRFATFHTEQSDVPYEVEEDGAYPLPFAVLTGPNTGGMGEVLAAALSAQGVPLYGTATKGAATAQTFFPLGEAGAGVSITTGYFLDSEGTALYPEGVLPDVELERQYATWLSPNGTVAEDAQLQHVLAAFGQAGEEAEDA